MRMLTLLAHVTLSVTRRFKPRSLLSFHWTVSSPDEWPSLPPQRPPPHTAHKAPSGAGASQQALTCGSPSPGPPSQAHGVCLGPGRWVSMELLPRSMGVQLENHTKAEELEDPVHGVLDVGGVVFQAEDEELLLVEDCEPV